MTLYAGVHHCPRSIAASLPLPMNCDRDHWGLRRSRKLAGEYLDARRGCVVAGPAWCRRCPPASIGAGRGPLLVTLFGGFLRFYRLTTPHVVVFDETYYVPDAYSILKHGVELNAVDTAKNRNVVDHLLVHGNTHILTNTGEYVVHPPLGKAMIAVGEWLFGHPVRLARRGRGAGHGGDPDDLPGSPGGRPGPRCSAASRAC